MRSCCLPVPLHGIMQYDHVVESPEMRTPRSLWTPLTTGVVHFFSNDASCLPNSRYTNQLACDTLPTGHETDNCTLAIFRLQSKSLRPLQGSNCFEVLAFATFVITEVRKVAFVSRHGMSNLA